jgi:hypothetical protein
MTDELAVMLRQIMALEAANPEETQLLNQAYDGIAAALAAISAYEERHQED